jgi:hypothetical protein
MRKSRVSIYSIEMVKAIEAMESGLGTSIYDESVPMDMTQSKRQEPSLIVRKTEDINLYTYKRKDFSSTDLFLMITLDGYRVLIILKFHSNYTQIYSRNIKM